MRPQEVWENKVLGEAVLFRIHRFEGQGHYTRAEAATLAEAQTKARTIGRGPYGHGPMIYAVNAAGRFVHVDDRMLAIIGEQQMKQDDTPQDQTSTSEEDSQVSLPQRFFVVDYRDLAEIRVAEFPDEEAARANCPSEGGASVITNQAALEAFDGNVLVAVYNRIRHGAAIKGFHDKMTGVKRVWLLLEHYDPAMINPTASAPTVEAPTETQDDMPPKKSKRAKKATTPKAKRTSANGHDQFGLRAGSKASQAAAMFARTNGATMAQVREKLGMNTYNLLASLKEAGYKIEKEEKTFYLTAK